MTETAICFDLDGTLLRREDPYDGLLVDAFEAHLEDPGPGLAAVYDDAFHDAFDDLQADPVRVGMAAVVGHADDEADPEAMAETLLERECAATSVDAAARESLAELATDASLGVVTNGVREWQLAKLRHHGIDGEFDAVVASYEAGAHKPDPAPFDLARERLSADEYAMVGDDYEADVEGARAAGFVPIHFEPDDGPSLWSTLQAML